MDMTDLDLPALRAVAERATPGPMDVWSIPQIDAVRDMQNMLSPARMLALLDRLEKAEKAADAVADERERLQAPAAPWTYAPNTGRCTSCGGTNGTHNEIPVPLPSGRTGAVRCPNVRSGQ